MVEQARNSYRVLLHKAELIVKRKQAVIKHFKDYCEKSEYLEETSERSFAPVSAIFHPKKRPHSLIKV